MKKRIFVIWRNPRKVVIGDVVDKTSKEYPKGLPDDYIVLQYEGEDFIRHQSATFLNLTEVEKYLEIKDYESVH